jgi:hypothetical protein
MKVRKLPKIKARPGEDDFIDLKTIAWRPKKKPLIRAKIIPYSPETVKSSRKNRAMPKNITATKSQSLFFIFSESKNGAKRATHKGAVYCNTTALAAVVSFMAEIKVKDNMAKQAAAR